MGRMHSMISKVDRTYTAMVLEGGELAQIRAQCKLQHPRKWVKWNINFG